MASCRDEDIVCQYCLQSLAFMSDPRELPCDHIFCITCLQADYRKLKSVECPVCRKLYSSIDIDSLPRLKNQSSDDDIITAAAPTRHLCYVCKEERSAGYCVDCGVHACSTHLMNHEELEHQTVGINAFVDTPDAYSKVLCQEHRKEIAMVCQTCQLLSCRKCDTTSDCAGANNEHRIASLSAMEVKIKREFDMQMVKCAEEITEICKVEKEVWLQLDQYKHKDANLVKSQSNRENSRKELFDKLTSKVETFVHDLLAQKDALEEALKSVRQFLRVSHVTEIIKQRDERKQQLESACGVVSELIRGRERKTDELEKAFRQMSVNDDTKPMQANTFAATGSTLSYRSLRFLSAHETRKECYGVSFHPSGELVVACDFNVHIYNATQQLVDSKKAKFPTSAVFSNGQIYYIDEYDGGKVKTCEYNFQNTQTLYNFHVSREQMAYITVSDKYIAIRVPSNRDMDIYHIPSQTITTTTLPDVDPFGVCFDSDGTLLVADAKSDTLGKYRLTRKRKLHLLWRCTELKSPSKICIDGRGYIFVGSEEKKVIYVLSQDGDLISRLPHGKLPEIPGGMSILGDTLAVACNDERCFKLFKII